jgi:hypothetical protein
MLNAERYGKRLLPQRKLGAIGNRAKSMVTVVSGISANAPSHSQV